MKALIQAIENYKPYNQQEVSDKAIILKALRDSSHITTRENKDHHLTASAWLINPERTKVLMVYHNIYDSWSWMGGHADGNPDLLQVAIKEVQEESGLQEVQVVSDQIFSLEILTVDGHVRRGDYVSSHLHLNLTYLLQASEQEALAIQPDENSDVAWFDLDQAVEASSEPWFRENIYTKLNNKLKEISI